MAGFNAGLVSVLVSLVLAASASGEVLRPEVIPQKVLAQLPALADTEACDADYTHIGPKGAEFFAAQVTEALAEAVPELGRLLVK